MNPTYHCILSEPNSTPPASKRVLVARALSPAAFDLACSAFRCKHRADEGVRATRTPSCSFQTSRGDARYCACYAFCDSYRRMCAVISYARRRRLPHYQPDDRALMVSFRVVRILTLPPEARSLVLEHCMREHIKRVRMYALVVMPDDVHLMFTPLRDAASRSYHLATILQAIKGSSAHSVNKLLHRQGPVWQEEYFDHVVRRYENLRAKIEYIRQSPVRKGLARTAEEYPWL